MLVMSMDFVIEKVDVELLGGTLKIAYEDGHIFMEGPARTVFEGQINEEEYKNV